MISPNTAGPTILSQLLASVQSASGTMTLKSNLKPIHLPLHLLQLRTKQDQTQCILTCQLLQTVFLLTI